VIPVSEDTAQLVPVLLTAISQSFPILDLKSSTGRGSDGTSGDRARRTSDAEIEKAKMVSTHGCLLAAKMAGVSIFN